MEKNINEQMSTISSIKNILSIIDKKILMLTIPTYKINYWISLMNGVNVIN